MGKPCLSQDGRGFTAASLFNPARAALSCSQPGATGVQLFVWLVKEVAAREPASVKGLLSACWQQLEAHGCASVAAVALQEWLGSTLETSTDQQKAALHKPMMDVAGQQAANQQLMMLLASMMQNIYKTSPEPGQTGNVPHVAVASKQPRLDRSFFSGNGSAAVLA